MIHNKMFLIPAAILATVLTFATFTTVSIYAQSEGTNQTMKDAGESANKTGEGVQGNASDMGSKISEGAKDLVGNIGDKLQDIGK
ncbi:MAG: hypothetical protein ACRD8K_00590 [Nitrososphaeraceae archaeon]